ncbi:MAG: hypothetical protein HY247_06180 [archaeon]|nr:MAG: hypothetical protein HY247_06180 [archaeon]
MKKAFATRLILGSALFLIASYQYGTTGQVLWLVVQVAVTSWLLLSAVVELRRAPASAHPPP